MVESKPIYFRGSSSFKVGTSYSAEMNLDALEHGQFATVFCEWVIQCWMKDTRVPTDPADLDNFDLADLIPIFRQAYYQGDWKRMRPGRGADLEEHLTWCDLLNRSRHGIVTVAEKYFPIEPKVLVPPGRRELAISSGALGACLANYLRVLRSSDAMAMDPEPELVLYSPLPKALRRGIGVMIVDSATLVGHVIFLRTASDDLMTFAYDDWTWPGGKSMLCEGENSMGVEAKYLGHEDLGMWVVSSLELTRVIHAVPLPLFAFSRWKEIAEDFSYQMDLVKAAGNPVQALGIRVRHRASSWLKGISPLKG